MNYLEMTERVVPFPDGSSVRQLVYRAPDGSRFEYLFRRRDVANEWELIASFYEQGADND